ncbi:hypothetical protein CDL62_13725 [Alkalitalea saponilacus]|nr:hypothetical protein CDL62_13725 [Alkalitalea saponilacus]
MMILNLISKKIKVDRFMACNGFDNEQNKKYIRTYSLLLKQIYVYSQYLTMHILIIYLNILIHIFIP